MSRNGNGNGNENNEEAEAPAPAPEPSPYSTERQRKGSFYGVNNLGETKNEKNNRLSGYKRQASRPVQGYRNDSSVIISPEDLEIIKKYKENIEYYEKLCKSYEGKEMQIQESILGFENACLQILNNAETIFKNGKQQTVKVNNKNKFTLETLSGIFEDVSSCVEYYDETFKEIKRRINLINMILEGANLEKKTLENNTSNARTNNASNEIESITSLINKLNQEKSSAGNLFTSLKNPKLKKETSTINDDLAILYEGFKKVKERYEVNIMDLNVWKRTHNEIKDYINKYIESFYTTKYSKPINELLEEFVEQNDILEKLSLLDKMIVQIGEFDKKMKEYDAIRALYPKSFEEYNNVKLNNSSSNNIVYLKKKESKNRENFNVKILNVFYNDYKKLFEIIENAKSQLITGAKKEAEKYSANFVEKVTSQIDKLGQNIENCINQSIEKSNFKNVFTSELKLQKLVEKFINSGYNFKAPNSYTQFNIDEKYNNLQSIINSSMAKITKKIQSNNKFAIGENRVEELPGNNRITNLNHFEEEIGNHIPRGINLANEYNNKTTLTRRVTNNESTQGSTQGLNNKSTQRLNQESNNGSTTKNSGVSNNQSNKNLKGFNTFAQAKEAFNNVLLKHKNESNSNAKKRAEFTNMRSYLTKLRKGLVNKSNDPKTRNGKTGAPQYIGLLGQAEEALKEKRKEIEKIKITKTAANAFRGLGK